MTADGPITAQDLLNAEVVLEHVSKNMELQFQIEHDSWSREKARRHFLQRQAVFDARIVLLDQVQESIE